MMAYDRRLEPRVGERVPYVIVYGMPGMPLIQLVRRPMEALQDPSLRLNSTYYITKQILPPLARIFQLIGVDVFSWYQELPRVRAHTRSVTTVYISAQEMSFISSLQRRRKKMQISVDDNMNNFTIFRIKEESRKIQMSSISEYV